MVGQPDVPPWRPIADWLARINDDSGSGTESQESIRERYETKAKAIAYDIYMAKHETAAELASDMKRQSPTLNVGGDE